MTPAAEPRSEVRLSIEGMSCVSCAARIERKLNKLEGVDATVNYATEQASVGYDPRLVQLDDLMHAIEATGYGASLERVADDDELRTHALRVRLLVSVALSA